MSNMRNKLSVVVAQAKKSLLIDQILWAFPAINQMYFPFLDTIAVAGYVLTSICMTKAHEGTFTQLHRADALETAKRQAEYAPSAIHEV